RMSEPPPLGADRNGYGEIRIVRGDLFEYIEFKGAVVSSDSRAAARPAAYARHGRASARGSN
ncbi:MAG: hypothetical protein IKX88_07860, partial [Thermoguttaceae bacterium]|nr:hypothetical protein [Thermoguttaceae bacterium]